MQTLLNMDSVDLKRGDEFYFLKDGQMVQTKCQMLTVCYETHYFSFRFIDNALTPLRFYADHQTIAKILD